jgi:hypothetical protein
MIRCLLAISSSNILTAGVERWLSMYPELDIVSLPNLDGSRLIEEITQNQADVVIIEGDLLGKEDFLTSLLTTRPELMVIKINPDDNQLHIYNHQHLSIRHPSELITLIRANEPATYLKEEKLKDE